MSWQEIAKDKKDRINASIPLEWRLKSLPSKDCVMGYTNIADVMSIDEISITNSAATDLVAKMAKGELTSVEVTTAFCKRAALAHQLINCALEFFPEMALARAKELDEHYKKTGKTIGPLHGLPISLKDQFRIKGLETSMGYISWLGKYEDDDSILVKLLLKAGAVFYMKTSVPQSLMCCETTNNIIGRTVNPYNKNWSCGGSSGGEGANIAFRGGIIGVGTDIGGSIRVPAAFNFLYGLRPSHGRLPYGKMANSMEGQETLHSVCGPITHSVADMRLFVESVLAEKPWKFDAKVVPMPWRQSEADVIKSRISDGGLTIGYYDFDGKVLPHPPILRGIKKVVDTLKENGHQVFEWKPYKHDHAQDLLNKIYSSDAGQDIRTDLSASGEPPIPNIADFANTTDPPLSLNELWDINLQRWAYQCEYLEQFRIMEEKLGREIDAIVTPVAATAAVRHDRFVYYGYTSVINLLDFTSVVVPVLFADKRVDGRREGYEGLNEVDGVVQGEYDPEAYHGAPVAVQIIGRKLTEERIMEIAEEIGRLLGNDIVS
ncbi:putative acetamidase protein [Botrytis fragariae]|uniref:amidase n=1 Tax=Botrytis fragariae TaxID=1964551 RepID=A0A8H6EI15_9HELO|nr:putative acetamidase protein [Botrytis fragariae]KAF5872640.1 putative acetamidase protein [Botrytis fragariae]